MSRISSSQALLALIVAWCLVAIAPVWSASLDQDSGPLAPKTSTVTGVGEDGSTTGTSVETESDHTSVKLSAPARLPYIKGQVENLVIDESTVRLDPSLATRVRNTRAELKLKTELDVVRIALVVDSSGSQAFTLESGAMQALLNRLVPLLMELGGNEVVDCWSYADIAKQMPPLSPANLQTYVIDVLKQKHPLFLRFPRSNGFLSRFRRQPVHSEPCSASPSDVGVDNHEETVMKAIVEQYKSASGPTLIIFITDGAVDMKGVASSLMSASKYPVFWQFVGFHSIIIPLREVDAMNRFGEGLRNSERFSYAFVNSPLLGRGMLQTARPPVWDYNRLQECVAKRGRLVDNANFIALDDFPSVTDSQLARRLTSRFADWVCQAKNAGIVRTTEPASTP